MHSPFHVTRPSAAENGTCGLRKFWERWSYLEQEAISKTAFQRFRQGLEILDAAERRKRVTSAYDSIVRVLGL
jgi:hypothetical protein